MKYFKTLHLFQGLLFCLVLSVLLLSFGGCSKVENTERNNDVGNTPVSSTTLTDTAETGGSEEAPEPTTTFEEGQALLEEVVTEPGKGVLSSGETIEFYVPGTLKNPGDKTVTLYIWNVDQYKTVQWHYRDTLTVQKLLEGLAHETNWNLTVSAIKPASEKTTILWSNSSSLFAGIPAKQNKEYIVFQQKDLDAAILDSVAKTIVENLGLGYTVCYAGPGGENLTLPGTGITIPAGEPYSSFGDYT